MSDDVPPPTDGSDEVKRENEDERGGGMKRAYSEETLTLEDVLEAESHWEETANAVLGASDNANCSYDKGYVKRQALYACLTCTVPSSPNFEPAGICLACSLKCHDGHDLVELYTKRNFRCDCGNQKFPSTTCKLRPLKDEFNPENTYNHNFRGLYCICERPYPDPDENDDDDDEMIQCVMCEDWLHGRHSHNDTLDFTSDETSEFICKKCTDKCDFLPNYGEFLADTITAGEETKVDEGIDIPSGQSEAETEMKDLTENSKTTPHVTSSSSTSSVTTETVDDAESQDSGTAASGSNGDMSEEEEGSEGSMLCLLEGSLAKKTTLDGGTWWKTGWRNKLCKCAKCLDKYKSLGVSFLLDFEDTLASYEAIGKEKGTNHETADDILNSALAKLDHVNQIEVVRGFNDFKESLSAYLRGIGESGRTITSEDIHKFFAEYTNKRRRLDNGLPPENCR